MGAGRIDRTIRRDYRKYARDLLEPTDYEIRDFRHDKMLEFLEEAIMRMRRELNEKAQLEESV